MLQRLEQDIKAALLGGDKERARALVFIKNSLVVAAKDQNSALSNEQSVQILRKELKKRREAAELFEKGGNQPSADKELSEATLIEGYLPAVVSEDVVRAKIAQIIAENNITKSPSSMGTLMPLAKQAFGSDVDPSTIARLAVEALRSES